MVTTPLRIWIGFAVAGLSLIVATGCHAEPHGIARRVQATCETAQPDAGYFGGIFNDEDDQTEARAQGVSKLLVKLAERSLACGGGLDEAYRVLYMPERACAFAISAQRAGTDYTVNVTYEGQDGNPPRRTIRQLRDTDWNMLKTAIDGYNFWSRPPHPTPTTINHDLIVVHGPAWLLEGRDNGWYHAVSRVSASKERAFDVPARTLFELAQLEVPDIVKSRP